MPDSEDDQHFTRTYHEYVHDDQGDVLLMCPSWDHDHERPAKTAFRVQTRHLVAHSDVFKDILDNVKTDKVTWDGLQYVDINEDEEAMAIVLAIACNMPVSSRAVNKMQWTTALATWEIANKYEMYAVRCAIGTKLLLVHGNRGLRTIRAESTIVPVRCWLLSTTLAKS